MIRFIAAIDNKRGLADDHGIPWQGKLPTDVRYYHDKISSGTLLMGYGLYKELTKPYPGGVNSVATSRNEKLRAGFEQVTDARQFLQSAQADVWNLGGAGLYTSTLDMADELYLTHIDADFHCTKFFPDYEPAFELVSQGQSLEENGLHFTFNVYRKRARA
jgi:dihydrofolate reductase